MAKDDTLRLRVTADTSAAEGDLRDLEKTADRIDLDVGKGKGLSDGARNLADMADSAGLLPGPLGAAAGLLTGPAGIAAGAVAGAGALFAMASSAADAATEAASLQAAVGGTIEETSSLLAATKNVGLEYNDVLELVAESNKAIGLNADEAERLGVNLSGTPIERFQQLVDAVYAIQDPLERSAAASKFFGEEGSKQLPQLIGLYGSLGAAIEAVPEAAVLNDDDVKSAKDFKLAMNGLKSEVTGLTAELGKALLPALTDMVELLNTAIDGAQEFGDRADAVGDTVNKNSSGVRRLGNEIGTLGGLLGDGAEKGSFWAAALEEDAKQTAEAAEAAARAEPWVAGLGDAMDLSGRLAGLAAEQYDRQAKAAEFAAEAGEALAEGLNAAVDAQTDFSDRFFELPNLVQANVEAFKEYADTVKDVGFNMDVTTEKGAAQQDALESLADAVDNQLATAYRDAAGDGDAFRTAANTIASDLRTRLQKELGFTDDEINTVLSSLGLMPDQVETRYELSGTEQALTSLELLSTQIDALPKDVQTTVTQKILAGDYVGALAAVQGYYNRNPVTVQIDFAARGLDIIESRARNLANNLFGSRAAQSTAARYVWRNGRYVEVG